MSILKKYVENVQPSIMSSMFNEEYNEVIAIYNWWVHTYPKREQELPELPPLDTVPPLFDDPSTPEEQEWADAVLVRQTIQEDWEEEETEMLIRLIKCRKYLWYP